jgi:endonuclease YncB( thermonuclease family)
MHNPHVPAKGCHGEMVIKTCGFSADIKEMKRNHRLVLAVLCLVLLLAAPAYGWSGRVYGVTDGDTISVLQDGRAVKIRLYGIDCPEKHQAFGMRARQFTSSLAFGKEVEVRPVDRDRYGRRIAWVYVGPRCLNEELLRAGFAWHFKRYSRDSHLAELELQARTARNGLWHDPEPTPPWEFRKTRNAKRPAIQTAAVSR